MIRTKLKLRSRIFCFGGFTLVELMITLVISSFIVSAVYSVYITQQRTYVGQDQVTEMQQNIRAGLMLMTSAIRMAGYDPKGTTGAGITGMLAGRVQFTQDITDAAGTATDGDGIMGDAGEMIDLGFSPAEDTTGNGIPDSSTNGVPDAISLRQQSTNVTAGTSGGYQPIAENIQAIEFRYLDSTGAVTTVAANVRSIQISILARAGKPDQTFTNTITYTTASGATWGPYNDHYRRRLLKTTVRCRNL